MSPDKSLQRWGGRWYLVCESLAVMDELSMIGLGEPPGDELSRQAPQSAALQFLRVLETPRLLLRHLEPADLPSLYALYRDPEIRRYFPDGTRTLEETKEELELFLRGHPEHPELGLWATVEKESGAFLGRCGLLPWQIDGQLTVELAFLIDKARWGEGLATEGAVGIVKYAGAVLAGAVRAARSGGVRVHGVRPQEER